MGKSKPTDAEILRTYATGLLSIALPGGGKVVEDALTSGLSAKLMHYLRTRAIGEASTTQNDTLYMMECKYASAGDVAAKLGTGAALEALNNTNDEEEPEQHSKHKEALNDFKLLPEVLELICALATHRQFAALFVDQDGMQKLLAVPRESQTYTDLSLCLLKIGSLQGIMKRVCALPSDVVNQMVELALQLLECPQDQARKNAAEFFAAAFVFRAVLDSFDTQGGLKKMLNLLHRAASVGSGNNSGALRSQSNVSTLRNDRSPAEVMTALEKQIALHTGVALRQYFRAHLLLLKKMLNLLHRAASVGSGNNSGALRSQSNVSTLRNDRSPAEVMTALEKQIALHTGVALRQYFRAHLLLLKKMLNLLHRAASVGSGNNSGALRSQSNVSTLRNDRSPAEVMTALEKQIALHAVVDKFLDSNGHITLLELCQAPVEQYVDDLTQYAFGVLQIVTLVFRGRKKILDATLSNGRVGMAVILHVANGAGYVDPEFPSLHPEAGRDNQES
ncbi:hypothetical protein H6P81_018097 [Aristolochia fimbriata]|uniref:Uncharacterized protein n=1 Tax=Aristolochia fimbriata TaxID=158543 RepID=A0AAV7E0U5_ARIFI|nr:hypothetical protein H6P81_018097 [Aristolochia fimbriata]